MAIDEKILEDFFGTHKRTWEELTEKERIYQVKLSIHSTAFNHVFHNNMDMLYTAVFKNGEPDDLILQSVYKFIADEFRNELETIELTEHHIKGMLAAVKPELYHQLLDL